MYKTALFAALLAGASATPLLGMPRSFSSVLNVDQSQWDSLNQSVSGRLQNGEPMALPCFREVDGHAHTPNNSACNTIQKKDMNELFITEHFGGYIYANWGACQSNGDKCDLNVPTPDKVTPLVGNCKQGSVPNRYIDVRDVSDIQHGLAFASKNNLRLVIKNTGHDYKGRSSAPDSLALWMHNYRPAMKMEKNFRPEGASSAVGDVITAGAGEQFRDVYKFVHKNGYRIVGGGSRTVGFAGGYLAGGGHSVLSNELGLAVDNVQQIKAVLPNGTYVTSNRNQNQDLFFALRGGGGGTFAVVAEISYLAHSDKPTVHANFDLGSLGMDNIHKLIELLVNNADEWVNQGFGAYLSPILGSAQLELVTTKLNKDQATKALKPVTDFITNTLHTRVGPANTNITQYDGFYDAFQHMGQSNRSNLGLASSSRLVTRKYFQDDNLKSKLIETLTWMASAPLKYKLPMIPLNINAVGPITYSQHLPESDKPGHPGAPSIYPAWRDTVWHVLALTPFEPANTTPSAINNVFKKTHELMNPLRELVPDSGAYQNEADTFEADPATAFWGKENYDRLSQIKKQVDPTNLLTVYQGIGSNPDDERYSCYPATPWS